MSGNISAAGVEETLKDFWVSRPRRPHDGRKIAGVAAGIAQRYQIDPVIVRVAFVAMALCNGAGVLVYLLGWLFLAQEGDESSAAEALVGRGRSSTPTPLTVALGIAVLPATGFFVDGGFTMVGGVLLSVGGIYLLHRGRGQLNRPAAPPTLPAYDPGVPVQDQTTERVTPPAWDPLGAAPFAWDLPEPAGVPEPVVARSRPVRRRSRAGVATFGVAMLVLAGSVIAADHWAWFTVPHVIGLLVAVMGLGMVVGALRGGGAKGLLWFVVPLSLVGVGMTAADLETLRTDRIGSHRPAPTAIEQVQPRYETGIGEVDLDLTGLPGTGSVKTVVEVGVGSARVTVPANADVVATCRADLGSTRCLGAESGGEDRLETVDDDGADGPGGLRIELDVRSELGEVVVSRG
ncbi:PspC domain-containing protein [Saccharothrix yanglingensis]|uniref:PspC domain-containing protein n=1 Tax=Saccharothrix yanglingensis TaxID=659496 RepID=UPI0027D24B9F|nr:PspC domain-containing protein [Saccharothrix yanglingensis]